jgi:hypothetical protein
MPIIHKKLESKTFEQKVHFLKSIVPEGIIISHIGLEPEHISIFDKNGQHIGAVHPDMDQILSYDRGAVPLWLIKFAEQIEIEMDTVVHIYPR